MYEWIKALHVIAVIAWMAGMLYLPRLFVYHCEAEGGSKQSETFKLTPTTSRSLRRTRRAGLLPRRASLQSRSKSNDRRGRIMKRRRRSH